MTDDLRDSIDALVVEHGHQAVVEALDGYWNFQYGVWLVPATGDDAAQQTRLRLMNSNRARGSS